MKRQSIFSAALAALLLHCGPAPAHDLMDNADLAGGNELYPRSLAPLPGTQDLRIHQLGSHHLAVLTQQGDSLLGSIVQQGSDHEAWLLQQGSNLVAGIWQQGHGHSASIAQFGYGNEAHIIQAGAHNTASIEQSGTGLYTRVTQIGVGQLAQVPSAEAPAIPRRKSAVTTRRASHVQKIPDRKSVGEGKGGR